MLLELGNELYDYQLKQQDNFYFILDTFNGNNDLVLLINNKIDRIMLIGRLEKTFNILFFCKRQDLNLYL